MNSRSYHIHKSWEIMLRWRNSRPLIDAVVDDEVIAQGVLLPSTHWLFINGKEITYEERFVLSKSKIALSCGDRVVVLRPTTFEVEEAE
jgi:hypothetical protein